MKCEYLPDKNSNSNKNMLFLRKTDETTWKPSFLREPSISEQFFCEPSFCPIFKNKIPNLILGGRRKLCLLV